MQKPIIVFSSQTLYAEGVVNRLREQKGADAFHYVNPDDADYLARIADLLPSVVIIDAAETDTRQNCILCELLEHFPAMTIVRLKIQEKEVQVIRSTRHAAQNVKDLAKLIDKNGNP